MTRKRATWLAVCAGIACLAFSFLALIGMQVCFTQNFWLHAMVFPINPQTVAQPTGLTYLGVACEIACPVFLLLGLALLLICGYHAVRYGMGNRAADSSAIS
jgi:hypothetical protein